MNKLGKIASIIVIVACLGSLYLAFTLGGKKKALETSNASLTQNLATAQTRLTQAQAQLKKDADLLAQAKGDLSKVNEELGSTKAALAQKTDEANGLQVKTGELEQQLAAAKTELATAKETIKIVQEITQTEDIKDLGKLREKLAAQADENKMLGEQLANMRQENTTLKQKLEELTVTPPGVRGRVAVVEKDWGFVVLDIGEAQRVRPKASFLVYRDNKLVGKVQVTLVADNTSIAEILPGYKGGPPRPGDMAVH
jgi:multidrug efflux pump subunit AcrA (membrane-fusion protein)